MLTYILETTLCWAGFYLLYVLLLRRETFFGLNRWYLLGTLALGLIIPLIEWPSFAADDNPAVVYLAPISVGVHQVEVTVTAVSEQPEAFDWMQLLRYLYWAGVAVFAVRLGIGLAKIYNLYQKGEKIHSGKLRLVYTEPYHLPFSFFNHVFWSTEFEAAHEEKAHILRHEEAHVSGWHTLDVLALEVLGIFLWCSPMIYFYRASLKTVHEYLADAAVLQTTRRKTYGKLLLKQSMSGLQLALTHQFFHSQLKDRILMMTRTKSRKEAIVKYFLILPSFFVLTILVAARTTWAQFDATVFTEKVTELFADFENQSTAEKLADYDELYDLIYDYKADYPEKAGDIDLLAFKAIENLPPIEVSNRPWTAEELDKIKKEVEAISAEFVTLKKEDAARAGALAKELTALTKKYIRARLDQQESIFSLVRKVETEQRAKAVNLYTENFDSEKITQHFYGILSSYNSCKSFEKAIIFDEFATSFRTLAQQHPDHHDALQGIAEKVTNEYGLVIAITRTEDKVLNDIVLLEEQSIVSKVKPIFSGCENAEDPQACSQKKLIEFVYKNIRYPAAARAEAVQGTVVISYTVNAEGLVENVYVDNSISPALNEEVMRVVKMMPRWTPASNDGKTVATKMTLPVRYKLEGENGESDDAIFETETEKELRELYSDQMLFVIGYGAPKINSDEVFSMVEEMPRYPGCEEMTAYSQDKKKCADGKLLEFIYENLKYPAAAKEQGVQGVVVVQFIVDKAGNVRQPKIVRSIGGNTDEEVLRVVNLMPKWIPGKQRGQNVNVQFNLPVRFKLNEDVAEEKTESPDVPTPDNPEVFKIVENMPLFPGTFDQKSSNAELLKSVYKNLNYPESAAKAGVEGMAVVKFVVDENGNLTQHKLYRAPQGDKALGTEALRVAKLLPNGWTPGKQRGRAVNVEYSLPIRFVLDKDKSAAKLEKTPEVISSESQKVDEVGTIEIFKVVEEMPRFAGSTNWEDSNEKLLAFVYDNLNYPRAAKEDGVQGTAVVQFVISKTGEVLAPKIVRSIGSGTDEEVLRVVKMMPDWIPGKQRGQEVNVQFNLPVRFVLPKGDNNPQLSTNNAPPAINNLQLINFTANPNPTDGDLNLRFEAEAQALTLTILDVTGKQVFRQELRDFDGLYQQQIDLRKAAKGVLFITIQQGDKVFTEQVILQ